MDEDLIRQLIEETEALPKHRLPEDYVLMARTMFSPSTQPKLRERYDQDMRRAYFLEEAKKRDPNYYHQNLRLRVGPEDEIRSLRSPYEKKTADSPLSTTGRWMASLPGAVYATGQMLANKFDEPGRPTFPNAYDDYAKNMNTFLVFGEPFGKNQNAMRDMMDMRDEVASTPWHAGLRPEQPRRGEWDQIVEAAYSKAADPKSGREYLMEAGVPEYVAMPAGGIMDAVLDPFFFPGKTWAGLGMDLGLGSAHGTLPSAIDAVEKLNELRPAWGSR